MGIAAADAAQSPDHGQLPRGATIGRYVILDQLGAGGMGVVYKAYDPELDRPIALKLLSSRDQRSDAFRERLLREAQALGRLSHPNVIAVHDVGTFGRSVFIAMEFVEGEPMRRWLDAEPRSRRAILDAFVAAGAGLAAAHQAGLVHRDFKPDNVIVGRDGRVRVLDFGLARVAKLDGPAAAGALPVDGAGDVERSVATVCDRPPASHERPVPPDREPVEPATRRADLEAPPTSSKVPSASTVNRLSKALTLAGSVLGTPRYMSPEQHLGDTVDERADQFSFCVSLYEALYGAPPFAGDDLATLRANVTEGRIGEPPASAHVPRWLRQVLVRGLAVDPRERHASMTALLAALRADPSVGRARWLRRAAMLSAVAGVVVAWRLAHREQVRACAGAERKLVGIWDEPRRAAVRGAFRHSGVPYAEAVLATVERTFDGYARQWVAMHTDACEATQVRGEQSQELLDLRMSCLSERLIQLKAVADVLGNADANVVEHAVQSAESLPALELCADSAALRAPMPPPADPEARRRVAALQRELARINALNLAGKYEESLALAADVPAEASRLQYPPIRAEAELALSSVLDRLGRFADARRALRQAFVSALAGRADVVLAQASLDLVRITADHDNDYDEADSWLEVAQASIARLGRADELRAQLHHVRSFLFTLESKLDQALDDARRALEWHQRICGPSDYRVADDYDNLGEVYDARGAYREALESHAHALAIDEQTLGPDHPKLAVVLIGIGNAATESGQHERAIRAYERALAILERVNPEHPNVEVVHSSISGALLALGNGRAALEHANRALVMARKVGTLEDTASALVAISDAELGLERPRPALEHARQALDVLERTGNRAALVITMACADMGEAYRRLGKLQDGIDALQRAISTGERNLGRQHPYLSVPLFSLGQIYLARHQPANAVVALERARLLFEAAGNDAAKLARTKSLLARAGLATDDRARAQALATAARQQDPASAEPARALDRR